MYITFVILHLIKLNVNYMNNLLIHSENIKALDSLNEKFNKTIDLCYIDPPFATGGDFGYSEDRIRTVSKSRSDRVAYSDRLVGQPFLNFLRERLVRIRELLSDEGSIYLHIDYKVGHYVKILMDEVFGMKNFRNDIARVKCNPKNFKRRGYGNVKDMILFYSKSDKPIWNEPKQPYTEDDINRLYPKKFNGRHYSTMPIHAPGETQIGNTNQLFKDLCPPKGRHWVVDVDTLNRWDDEGLIEWSSNGNPRKRIFADEQGGKRVQDIWSFKDPQYPCYPTEKNSELLDLIVRTSSNEGSIVLDCFCGSGSTLAAAQRHNRHWIGVDESDVAIEVAIQKINMLEETANFVNRSFDVLTM